MAVVTDRQRLLAVARGDQPADLVVRDARVFSVFTREWLEGDVAVADGRFAGIGSYVGEETLDARGTLQWVSVDGTPRRDAGLAARAGLAWGF